MLLADTNAQLSSDGTLGFALPGFRRSRYSMAPWSRGLGTECVRGRRREASVAWPIVVVPRDGADSGRNPDVDAFVAGIPEEARRLVAPYRFGQCALLQSLAAFEQVADLAESNPNLLWLLALSVYECRVPVRDMGALCRRRQADLLGTLAGSAGGALVRFVRKVRLDEGTLSEARVLFAAVREPAIASALRHDRTVPIRLLALLTGFPWLADETLVRIVAAKLPDLSGLDPMRVGHLQRALTRCAAAPRPDAVRAAFDAALGTAAPARRTPGRPLGRPLPPAAARAQAHPLPAEAPALPDAFPPPPLPGTPEIVPITTMRELVAEGAAQKHCVASYAAEIHAGRVYIYRVLAPQRATLEVRLDRGAPRLGQFKRERNRNPSAAAFEAVRMWLAAAATARALDRGAIKRT